MIKEDYKGYFGLDFLVEEKTGEVFLLEINARMTASTSFYTQLEIKSGVTPLLFYHMLSFLKSDSDTIKSLYRVIPHLPAQAGLIREPVLDSHLRGNNKLSITGTQLILRNNQPKIVTIKKSLKSGIYYLTTDARFKFIKPAYQVTNLIVHPERPRFISRESKDPVGSEIRPNDKSNFENHHLFLLSTPAKGTQISPESEILKCETLWPLVSHNYVLTDLTTALINLKSDLLKKR